MSSLWLTILQYAGVPAGALATILGARWSNRSTRRAQEITEKIEQSKLDLAALTESRQTWESAVKTLRDENDAKSNEINTMKLGMSAAQAEADNLRSRISGYRKSIESLQDYVHVLLRFIKRNRLTAPPAPEGVDI